MAILPLQRLTNFDVPTYPLSAARVDPSTFANLSSIGEAIGERRERSALGEILAGATDASGNLDLNKAATAIALSGRDPTRYLNALSQQQTLARSQAGLAETIRSNKEAERQRQEQLDRPQYQVQDPSLMRPGGYWELPRKSGEQPKFVPLPTGSGPQSSLAPPAPVAAAEPNPEEAPPYRVAGPPMPPPSTPATSAPAAAATPPAATPARNEAFLSRLPPAAQTIIKGIAEYEIDPSSLTGKDREEAIAAAKMYRPDYSMSEYQKRGSPPSGEVASRIGLAKAFLDRVPIIEKRLQADELNSAEGRGLAMLGQGGPGELRRAIDEGSEALLRGLTGAGMSQSEATNYQRRYQFSLIDTKETQLRKLNELQNALRYVSTEVGKGRGGEDLMKDYRSKFGESVLEEKPAAARKPLTDAEVNRLVARGRDALTRDPNARQEVYRIMRERGVPNPEILLGR